MASNVTYVSALTTIIEFAKTNNFDNTEVLEKLEKLRDQKATRNNTGRKSPARKENEILAKAIVEKMIAKDAAEIRAAWVRDNVDGINTIPKATAVLNVAIDMGLIEKTVIAKSATRNECVYSLPLDEE
jgi:hypothetical protein